MAAITWRNVDTPNFGEANRAMYLGQMGINNGFDKLGDILKQQESLQDANWKQGKENNTNDYMNALAEAKTPEEFQAKQAFLAQMRQGFGSQADQVAMRKAEEGQLALLQGRALQNQQYADQQKEVQARPINDQLGMMALSDDPDVRASAKAALAPYTSAGMLNKPVELAAKIDAASNAVTARDRSIEAHGWAREDQKQQMLNAPLERQIKQAQLDEILAKPEVEAKKRAVDLAKVELDNFHKTNMYGRDRFSDDPTVNSGIIFDTVSKTLGKDGDKASVAISTHFADPKNAYYTEKKEDGTEVKLPYNAAVIKQAMSMTNSGSSSGFLGIGGSSGYGDAYVKQVIANANDIMKNSTRDINETGAMNSYARLESLSNLSKGIFPKPTDSKPEVSTPNASTKPLEQAAAKVVTPETKPKEPSEIAKVLAAAADVGVLVPSAAISAVTGAVNATGVLPQQLPVPIMDKGYVPFSDALKRNPEVLDTPSMSLGKSSAFTKTGALPASTIEQNRATIREKLNPTPVGYNDRVASIAALDKVVEKRQEPAVSPEPKKYSWGIQEGKGTKVRIKKVSDGDTIEFESLDGKPVPGAVGNVGRFASTDADETAKPDLGLRGQAFGEKAKEYLQKVMKDKEVTIQVTGQASRGDTSKTRNLIDIEVDGVPIEIAMVRAGYTEPYLDYLPKGSQRRIDLERELQIAQTEQVGMYDPELGNRLTAKERRKADASRILNK